MIASTVRVLSVIPPMTQLNTPYPSTAYLTGFLRSRGVHAVQEDLALALILKLLSRNGLRGLHEHIASSKGIKLTPAIQAFTDQFDRYHATINAAIAYLQGRDATLAHPPTFCGPPPRSSRSPVTLISPPMP